MINKKNSNKILNRILIIHTDGNTFNNPSLKCIIDLLIENGFKVDLRYPESYAPMPSIDNIRFIPFGRLTNRLKNIVFNRLCLNIFMYLSVFIENILLYKKYDLIIGVDRQGLLEANILNKILKTPYVFISFEITFASEISSRYKELEKQASKNVSYWIIQDNVRAQKLAEENSLQNSNKFLLPLASACVGKVNNVRLRDNLNIPKTKNVVIVIGSMSTWSMTNEIIRSVIKWPDDWVLILHERYGRTNETLTKEFSELKELIGNKIYISNSATEMVDDMSMILSGVDVGLAFYQPDYTGTHTGNNIKYLGLASGKISTYFRYGVPVIVNDIGLYADEVKKYKLGYVVENIDNISGVLQGFNDIGYSDNTKKYFSEYLNFNIYAEELLSKILLVIKGKH